MVDLRWLAPLPMEDILREAEATGRVLVVDETRRTGGISEGVLAALVDAGYARPHGPRRQQGLVIPLGDAAAARPGLGGGDRARRAAPGLRAGLEAG